MYIDYDLVFSNAQAVTADAASTSLDIAVGGSPYDGMWLVAQVNTTLASSGSAGTLLVKFQTDDNNSYSSATDLYISETFAEADLVAKKVLFKIRVPIGCERYIRCYYDVNNADPFTSGKLDVYLTPDVEIRFS